MVMSGNILTFTIPPGDDNESPQLKIKVHQATTDDNDQGENQTNTGFVMWPASVLLAHHLSKNPRIWRGDDAPSGDIMELGAGCGLAGLTVAALLQSEDPGNNDMVTFTDYNPAVLENLRRNILLNEFDVAHEVFGLDWFDQQSTGDTWVDTEGISHGQFRLILGADLIVCTNDADLVATSIDSSLMKGGVAIILGACADRRFGISDFPEACRSLGLLVTVEENMLEARERAGGDGNGSQQLMNDLELSGQNQRQSAHGDFTMFTITKPIACS
jgi:predicted nicotinamide N-methyase